MSCNCEVLQKRLENLQKKYVTLKRNHRKLLGVTVLITDALEEFIRGDVKTEINNTLMSCSSIYPDLFQNGEPVTATVENLQNEANSTEIVGENGKVYEPATESEREYYEGFWSRPRIPRTPQV